MSNLKFLLDEDVPFKLKELLEAKGYEVEYVPKGVSNSEVASLAKKKAATLISLDKDFLRTSIFPPKEFCGIIVLRVSPPEIEKLWAVLSSLLESVKEFKGKTFEVGIGWSRIIE